MPSEAVRLCPLFPETFANLYASGEVSGKLDESLRHLNRLYNEDGTRKLNAFATWMPRLIYMLVALLIAYEVIQFWTGIISTKFPMPPKGFNSALRAGPLPITFAA
jgi:type II secretory pathway component PulF